MPAIDFFPHQLIRERQDELLKDMEAAFKEKKILLAHAPTGLGKTATALAAALSVSLDQDKIIFFLTNRHTQHQIAIETLKLIQTKIGKTIPCVDLIGKRWMCNQDIAGLFGNDFNEFCKSITEKGECEFYSRVEEKKGLTVEAKNVVQDLTSRGALNNEEVKATCQAERMCSYEISIALAKKAKVVIGDYYYLFHPQVQGTLFNKTGWGIEKIIVIVDEGHNLPSRVTEMLSNNLTSYMLKNSLLEAKKYHYGGLINWLQNIMSILNELADFSKAPKGEYERKIEKDDFVKRVEKFVNYKNLIDELEIAANEVRKKQKKSYLGGISSFLSAWQGEDKGFCRILSQKDGKYEPITILSYSCLDPAMVTRDIFEQVHAGVIMSGTLSPTFMYKDVLGINKNVDGINKSVEKEYSSPFPKENKMTLVIPETSTKFTLRGEGMFQKIADKCADFCRLIPGNVALFFPSYYMRDQICNFLKTPKKLFWEKSEMTKEDKEMLLAQFKAEKDIGGVLLGVTGANFAEGIDFPGDLLNGVVVIGLPLSKPDLHTKEVINYYEQKFNKGWDYGYTFPAISKCIQSAGRCIRSETDRGVVVYLDERFAWKSYLRCFPERDKLNVTKVYEENIKKFFQH
ncbi:ATP-dependent DNA helicase [Candidatus Woesearchaeota archaeon]|nr:ATP-dependent DNA helicase [Candidatus Woesearchaeota archaeon]